MPAAPAAGAANVLDAVGRAAALVLEGLAVVVIFRVLGLLGGRLQSGIDIQFRRRRLLDFANLHLVELLGFLLLRFLALGFQHGRVALVVLVAEVRQQQDHRKEQEVETETAGIPD
jgi:hypothetical protein